jgi:nicotinamide riboside kinase
MLAESLAGHFGTQWVREFAREYLEKSGPSYSEEDILSIAKGQLERENLALSKAGSCLFCDTDFLVLKIWSLFRFGRCHPWILDMVESHRYDYYLLCDIDLPWEFDPLREHPDRRRELMDIYVKELSAGGFPFGIVRGTGGARLRSALEILEANGLTLKH